MSHEKAQRMYDRQAPQEYLEPTDTEVDNWVSRDGAELVVEAWQDSLRDGNRYLDLVEYIESHWEYIVEMYIENYTPPEPPDYTRKELEL